MLRLPTGLLFPSLKVIDEVSFIKGSNAKTRLFSLDWDEMDIEKRGRWNKQFQCDPPPVSYQGSLPSGLVPWMHKFKFALTEDYLQEIRHCSFQAAEEWSRKKLQTKYNRVLPNHTESTVAVELSPAISYVDSAFHLLADCLFDPETNYYSRSGIKLVAPYAFSYRFWTYQVPYWNAGAYTDLQELKRLLEGLKSEDLETYTMGSEIMTQLEAHLDLMKKNHYWPKQETVKSDGNDLVDFLMNKQGMVCLSTTFIRIDMPEIGLVTLKTPNLHRKRGMITLNAEFSCNDLNKALQALSDYQYMFTFPITHQGQNYMAVAAKIISISSTPPPIITMEFKYLKKAGDGEREDAVVARIDKSKIENNLFAFTNSEELETLYQTLGETSPSNKGAVVKQIDQNKIESVKKDSMEHSEE